ncbi:MAG: hypothetical protein KBD44_02765 [Candidatus Pacebacteria bacterium]|nr:hypothetical protein [Candidatus Paceibacterota bacterium]
MKDTFDEKMTASKPAQSTPAREAMFARVMEQVPGNVPVSTKIVSPYTAWLQKPSKTFVVGVLGVFLIVGMSSTVVAAEASKPGDFLFSIDQKTEAMRLFLANEERRAALRSAFLDERQQELAAIIAEEIEKTKKEIEDMTNGVPVTKQGEERITRAVDAFLLQAEQLPKSDTEGRRRAVITLIDEIRVQGRAGDDMRLRIDEDRFEIRTDNMRVRSRDDGEVEVRIDRDDEDGDDDSDRSDRGSDDDRQFDDSDARGMESVDSFDDQKEDDSYDDSGRDNVKDVSDSSDEYDDNDDRFENHSGKDENKDEYKDEDKDRDEDKKDDNSGQSDDN